MRGTKKKTTLRLTLSAVSSALGVILLWLGGLVQIIDLSVAVLASLLVVFAVIELKGAYPYLIYAVTSVLTFLLMPASSAGLAYVLFAGYYPIIKALLEGHLPTWAAWTAKMAVFAAGAAGVLLISQFVLLWPMEWLWSHWYILFVLPPIFVLYDVALTRAISAYLFRWRERLRIPNL